MICELFQKICIHMKFDLTDFKILYMITYYSVETEK